MNILLIGGTGNISTGIVKALKKRFASPSDHLHITVFNRGKTDDRLDPDITRLHGDRNDVPAFEKQFANVTWDAVIDMICYRPEQAQSDLRAFAGKTAHFIFCSTVCTYGNTQTAIPTTESTPQKPHSNYARNKLACEQIFDKAFADGAFGPRNGYTNFRPSHTIGAGNNFHGQLGCDGSPAFIDRLRKGLPVIVSGDGHGLWQMASSDDVGLGFAHAVGRPHTFGESYNIAADEIRTWDQVTQAVAAAIGAPPAKIVHIPTDLLLTIDPNRYAGVRDIFQYHGLYSNDKIHRDIPEFQNQTPITTAIKNTVDWMQKHNKLPDAESDPHESRLIEMFQSFQKSATKELAPKPK